MAALPLPAVIAGAFETLRIQSELAANFAPLQDQQNVLAAIQGLGQQMNQRFEQMNQRFDTLENRQINFEIAAVNARLVQADSAAVLQRPVDIRDGGDIPNFPATQQQLYTMNDAEAVIDTILPALGINLPPDVPLAIKRESIIRRWILNKGTREL
ncbi:hypothetical protein B0H67DRAFT_588553 [Lasiosphaeris hirsuta]|uniref:Uncharacterized protein n=1 Tax=Lasiosphaeris hirsuta TaxID=260670 RepID=A0AA40A1Z5_9PEZI|nr:hypothetical protein B0H67DRAFT_588553 [Lasiosphaeris hirsuta]